jgi:hypothetical protein
MEAICYRTSCYDSGKRRPLIFFVLAGKITGEKRGRGVLD